ncbi:MAG: F0F1 ATP synthase subunit A [Oligoflexia bacterium]|nr:F0F1 ATP synthase subunit A [Oligoflexia bacterium]
MHFSWFQLIPGINQLPVHVASAAACTLIIAIISIVAWAVAGKPEEALIPDAKPSLRNFFEVVVEGLSGFVDSILGHGSEKYVPLIGSMFLFILVNNFFGLLPGFTPSTDNMNTAFAVGLFVFVFYNVMGVVSNGLGYIKHFFGPLIWIAPLMFVIEIISHIVRPFSLGLRLSGNMTGDHTVLGIFLELVPVGIPMIFYVLGMFVCFVQAFVFSLLSMVYISMATAHDH